MVVSITDVLNTWDSMGVFDYVIPFLLIFAVVFAILQKTKILTGSDGENNGVLAIISVAVGLLSLQFDFVSEFYKNIFPKFGVGLSIFLVLLIFLGFFYKDNLGDLKWIGYVVGVGAVLWAIDSWDSWGNAGFGNWFNENFWAIVVLGLIVGAIVAVKNSGVNKSPKTTGSKA
jgi:hypothetical protein